MRMALMNQPWIGVPTWTMNRQLPSHQSTNGGEFSEWLLRVSMPMNKGKIQLYRKKKKRKNIYDINLDWSASVEDKLHGLMKI